MKFKLLHGDKVIWAIFFMLCIISVVEVSSAASYLVLKEGSFAKPIIQQTIFILMAIVQLGSFTKYPIATIEL